MRERLFQAVEGKHTAKDKLFALFEVMRGAPRDGTLRGEDPVMNLAVESNDADPKLRDAARECFSQAEAAVNAIGFSPTAVGAEPLLMCRAIEAE
jgi:hypothetical protein